MGCKTPNKQNILKKKQKLRGASVGKAFFSYASSWGLIPIATVLSHKNGNDGSELTI